MSRLSPRRALPFDQWPQPDQDAWTAALKPQSPFEGGPRPQVRWAEVTINNAKGGYGRWLAWLKDQDDGDLLLDAALRASEDNVRAYLVSMESYDLADLSLAQELANLARALKMIAPAKDWSWIARAGHRIQAAATPRRSKPICRSTDTLALGFDLMRAAEEDRHRSDLNRAVLYRDGLIIAFLTHRPIRRGNLASLELGRHLQFDGRACQVVIPGSETKNGRELAFEWPHELLDELHRYLEGHRPRLLADTGANHATRTKGLWVTRNGTKMDDTTIAVMCAKRTEEALGERSRPHAFRSIATTTIATEAPENVTDAARILGHATLATTEANYIQAQTSDAALRFQAVLNRTRRR
jgi:integrase/recombinase XerD